MNSTFFKDITKLICYPLLLIISLLVISCGGGGNASGGGGSNPDIQDHKAEITSFKLKGIQSNTTISESQIQVVVPTDTKLDNLIAEFEFNGKFVTVNGAIQNSGNTANDFTNEVEYVVTALDGATTKTYHVNVTNAKSDDNYISDFKLKYGDGIKDIATGHIDGENILVEIPYNISKKNLVATYTTMGIKVTVNGVIQISGNTVNNFTNEVEYVVTAQSGKERQYRVIVTNAKSEDNDIKLFSIVTNGTQEIKGSINGLDISVQLPYGMARNSLLAKYTTNGIKVTVNGVEQVSGQTRNDFTNIVNYVVEAANGDKKNYRVSVTNALNDDNTIQYFALKMKDKYIVGNVDQTTNNILVEVPFNNNVENLVAKYITNGVKVTVGDIQQISEITANDFKTPVKYTVEAANGDKRVYTVSVKILPSNIAEMLTFSFVGIEDSIGVIASESITIKVPVDTDLKTLRAKFTYNGKEVKVGNTPQISEYTANDFTTDVKYDVYAEDGTKKTYFVHVELDYDSENTLDGLYLDTRFLKANNETNELLYEYYSPDDTFPSAAIVNFKTKSDGAVLSYDGKIIKSGDTIQNLSDKKEFVVTSKNGKVRTYKITMVDSTVKFTKYYFMINGIKYEPVHMDTNEITLIVPQDVDITNLVAYFETSSSVSSVTGDSSHIEYKSKIQISGETTNDFSGSGFWYYLKYMNNYKYIPCHVTVLKKASFNSFTLYDSFGELYNGVINENTHEINFNMDSYVDLSKLKVEFTTSNANDQVFVEDIEQKSGDVRDFSNKVATYNIRNKYETNSYKVIVNTKTDGILKQIGAPISIENKPLDVKISKDGSNLFMLYQDVVNKVVKVYSTSDFTLQPKSLNAQVSSIDTFDNNLYTFYTSEYQKAKVEVFDSDTHLKNTYNLDLFSFFVKGVAYKIKIVDNDLLYVFFDDYDGSNSIELFELSSRRLINNVSIDILRSIDYKDNAVYIYTYAKSDGTTKITVMDKQRGNKIQEVTVPKADDPSLVDLPMIITPNKQNLYAVTRSDQTGRSTIYHYKFENDGRIKEVVDDVVSIDGVGIYSIAISPDNKYMYALHYKGIITFRILDDGRLVRISAGEITGLNTPWGIITNPVSNYVYVPGYNDATISTYSISQ